MSITERTFSVKRVFSPNKFKEFEEGWCRNFKGFIQYRHILETKNK